MTKPFNRFRPVAELTDDDFNTISQIAQKLYGLNLEPTKKALIQSRLSKRLNATGLSSFNEYCSLVKDEKNEENRHFISALTTNVTHFYREKHHYDTFEKDILPGLVSRLEAGGRVRLWSAGCSTGQEAYSLAGSIFNYFPNANKFDLRILATDIDDQVLEKAKVGKYQESELNFPSPNYQKRIFDQEKNTDGALLVKDNLAEIINFRSLNLQSSWPFSGKFDVIFCRNVAIYFSKETQANLWERLVKSLSESGTIFIGHSERIHSSAANYVTNTGITTYQRKRDAVLQKEGVTLCR